MHRTDKHSQHSSIMWPVWLNGCVFVYELSGCGFESRCSHSYIKWLPFMVNMCRMIISLGFYFIFSKFWFFGLLGGKRAKDSPKWQNIMSVALHIWGTMHYMTVIYVCKMIISSGIFFIFSKFWFSGSIGGKSAKNSPAWQKTLPVALHISRTIIIYGENV